MSSEFAELSERLRLLSVLIATTPPFRAGGPLAERACLAVLARKYPDDLRRLVAELEEPEAPGRTVAERKREAGRDER